MARTDKKARAAHQNGRKRGRRPTWALVERLLGQKLLPEQVHELNRQWSRNQFVLVAESEALLKYFGVSPAVGTCPYDTTIWRRKTGRMPKQIRFLAAKFRREARHLLEEAKATTVKDYYIVRVLPSDQECARWAEKYAANLSMPPYPPPRWEKKYFRDLRDFHLISVLFQNNPDMTAAELKELGGSSYTAPVENGLLNYLRGLSEVA